MIRRNDWEIDDPQESSWQPGEQLGTTIVVSPVIRKVPDGVEWRRLIDELAYIYTPAIREGVQIRIKAKTRDAKPEVLSPWSLPEFEAGHVDTHIEVSGKRARVLAGVVKEGVHNERPGLTYMDGFRVIEPASAKGCGAYPANRIAGVVKLLGGWALNKNKDGIQNAEGLYEAVECAILEVLRRAEQTSTTIRSAAFTRQVEGMLNAALTAGQPDTKARRYQGSTHGTAKPTGTGSKHRRAQREQDGETYVKQKYGSIRVAWGRLGNTIPGRLIGQTVELNLDNRLVDTAHRDSNALATVCIVSALLANEASFKNIQLKLPQFEEEDDASRFARTMGALMAAPVVIDGQDPTRPTA
jgi:hypothetical protein